MFECLQKFFNNSFIRMIIRDIEKQREREDMFGLHKHKAIGDEKKENEMYTYICIYISNE